MANKLRNVRLTSVDLVREGANQEADICLYKSWGGEPTETPAEKPETSLRTVSKSDPDRFVYLEEVFP